MMKTFKMINLGLMNYFLGIERPSQIHQGAAKRILRYLQGTKEFGIWYKTMTNSRFFQVVKGLDSLHDLKMLMPLPNYAKVMNSDRLQ
ncbi:hypothetical protein CR513_31175, partial [Mucuna pruriens]